MNIVKSPSPNFYGRQGYKPELIVVHVTDGSFPGDLNHLRNPNPGGNGPVSAHDLIAPDGTIHELVQWQNAAWHAGRILNPTAKLLKKNLIGRVINPNLYSYGIEVSVKMPALQTQAQLESLVQRIKDRCALLQIPIDRDHIIGHKEIFAAKTCPGTINVDELMIALLPPPLMVDKEDFKRTLIKVIQSL